MKLDLLPWFEKVVAAVFGAILIIIMFGIIIGTVQLFVALGELLRWEGIGGRYLNIITDVLTLFVLIELSRSLVEYFNSRRLRMTFIVDAALVFVLREIMISLFKHELQPTDVYALSTLLLVLAALRIGSVVVFQREQNMLRAIRGERQAGKR